MKKILISGITGQDGSYLAEYLLEQGYDVHGLIRRVAVDPQERFWRIAHILDRIHLHYATLENYASILQVFQQNHFDEVYHLAAQSFVQVSFQDEFSTMGINVTGTHHILSALRLTNPDCKFYFAASSEMFGKTRFNTQKEEMKFFPRSVYGISKVAGYEMTRYYREAYGMFACSGILFNHESPRRGIEFVTRKITHTAARIKCGLVESITLGNIDVERDWGYAPEYVEAMHEIMQQEKPDDFIIATSTSYSVSRFLDLTFQMLGLKDYREYLITDTAYFRPSEVYSLRGDYTKAFRTFGWKPKIQFEQLVQIMVESDYEKVKND